MTIKNFSVKGRKGRILTGVLLTASLSFGMTGVASADSNSNSEEATSLENLLDNQSESVTLADVEDSTAADAVDELLGDTELPRLAEELIGTSIDVDVLEENVEDIPVYSADGRKIVSENIPSLSDVTGEVALIDESGNPSFVLKPADSGVSESIGSAVLTNVDGKDISVVSQVTENLDAQLIAVIDDESTDYIDFSFDIPEGYELVPFYGGFVITDAQGRLEGWIEPAWAVDAQGRALTTSYDVLDNGVIRQNIDTSNATYPLVADPKATKSSSSTCSKVVGLYGIAHSTLWGVAVGGAAGAVPGAVVGEAYGLFWYGVTNYLC